MIIIQFVIAMLATISFAILFTAPKKEIIFCGLTGAFGWIVYYLFTHNGMHLVLASGIATFCLTILARRFAVIRKTPVTVYLLAGIFPLVPGAGIYYTAYYLFIGNTLQALFFSNLYIEVPNASRRFSSAYLFNKPCGLF